MIRYIVADDEEPMAKSMDRFLQTRIQTEFKVSAQGTICLEVDDTLSEINKSGSDLDLIVLDLEFHQDLLGGGLAILEALSPQQKDKVVVFSAKVYTPSARTNKPLVDELRTLHGIAADRIIDTRQLSDGLWNACSKVLQTKLR